MTELVDRCVVVTGSASGIGAAVVDVVVERGGLVIAVDREREAPRPGVIPRTLDVASESEWEELADDLEAAGRVVHGLVNCAGVTWRARFGDVSAEALARVLDVNVRGPMIAAQALLPLMPRGASIVNLGSLAGLNGHYPAAYTTSKWAVRGLTRSASTELGRRGIRVNVVHPGFIDTPMTASAPSVMRTCAIDSAPLGRVGSPREVATVVAFLLSEDASFVTGAEIAVDGGAAGSAGAQEMSNAMRPSYVVPD